MRATGRGNGIGGGVGGAKPKNDSRNARRKQKKRSIYERRRAYRRERAPSTRRVRFSGSVVDCRRDVTRADRLALIDWRAARCWQLREVRRVCVVHVAFIRDARPFVHLVSRSRTGVGDVDAAARERAPGMRNAPTPSRGPSDHSLHRSLMRHTSLTCEVCGHAEKQGTRVAAPGHGAQPGGGMASRAAGPLPSIGYRRVSFLLIADGGGDDVRKVRLFTLQHNERVTSHVVLVAVDNAPVPLPP